MSTMKRLLAAVVVVAASVGVAIDACGQGDDDEKAIRSLIESHYVALNKGDAKAASAVYSDDATVVTNTGQVYAGRAGVDQWHAEAVSGPRPFVHRHPPETLKVYFLTPVAAVVDVETEIPRPAAADGQPTAPIRVPLVVAVVKRDGEWRVAAQRQAVIAPKP